MINDKICQCCRKPFQPVGKYFNKFCSKECLIKWHNKAKQEKEKQEKLAAKQIRPPAPARAQRNMISEVDCEWCKERFKPTSSRQKFCTPECGQAWWRQKRTPNFKPTTECAWCGNSFETAGRKKFCSSSCARAYNRDKNKIVIQIEERPCVHCGISFMPLRPKAKYCSTKCYNKAYRNQHQEGDALEQADELIQPQTIERACAYCNNLFTPKESYERYCSTPCYKKADERNRQKWAGLGMLKPAEKSLEDIELEVLELLEPGALPTPPTTQQKEIANLIGLGIAWLGNVRDLYSDEMDIEVDFIVDRVKQFELPEAQKEILRHACSMILGIIQDVKSDHAPNDIFERAFSTMRMSELQTYGKETE